MVAAFKIFLGITVLISIGCKPFEPYHHDPKKVTPTNAGSDKSVTLPADSEDSEIDLAAINKAMNPCEDFYEYACGAWIKNFKLPDDKPSYGKNFNVIDDRNTAINKELLEAFAAGQSPVAAKYSQKLAQYYAACMNTDQIEKDAPQFVVQQLEKIQNATKEQLPALLASLHLVNVDAFFNMSLNADAADSNSLIAELSQGGMGLGEKSYYLKAENEKTRAEYLKHIAKMFVIAGVDTALAEKNAQVVMAIETQLAQESLTRGQVFDPSVTTNPTNLKALEGVFAQSDFALASYLNDLGLNLKDQKINVTAPKYLQDVVKVLKTTSLEDLKVYLKWHFLHKSASVLNEAYRQENFAFYGMFMRGAKSQPERWEVCVSAVDSALGEALGEAFVNKTFGAEGKKKSMEMVNNIQAAFEANLNNVEWLDQETKTKASQKLHKFITKIGYPDKFRNYDDLKVSNNFVQNVFGSRKFESLFQLNLIGKPVDKSLWGMSPATVNAYYNPPWNEIVFPAGILQVPFFGLNFSEAANYGAIGAVIGHELTHGFDSGGRQYDGDGNVIDWWTEKSTAAYKEKSQCIVNQYNQYKVGSGTPIDGKLTLTENIADIGGLKVSYLAYQKAAGEKSKELKQGYTGDQRFFLSFAQAWCAKETPQYADNQAKTNEHANPKYRVIGSLVNTPAFSKAFSCKEGTKMAPAAKDRCTLW